MECKGTGTGRRFRRIRVLMEPKWNVKEHSILNHYDQKSRINGTKVECKDASPYGVKFICAVLMEPKWNVK